MSPEPLSNNSSADFRAGRHLLQAGIGITLILAMGPAPGGHAAELLCCDMATTRPHVLGAPRPGDVILRSLRLRPINKDDPHDTMQALRDFHATTLAWTYIDDPKFIARVKQSGRVFGGAAAAPSYIGPKDGGDWLKELAILNRRGEVVIAPWKRNWKPTLWGCLNNPTLEKGYLAYLKHYVDAGAEIMQRDEPRANDSAVKWGGCFCEHCVKGFREYLATHTTRGQRQKLGISPLDTFDYRTRLTRQTIAMAYACGGHCMVPWDVYMPGDAPRYFGNPSQYADLFGFIRANSPFLDGFEQAEAGGYGVPVAEQSTSSAVHLVSGERVFVSVRAIPGKRDAPVVLHLVDWADDPQPFTLMLDPSRFFGKLPLVARLLKPAPYDRAAHESADRTGDYRALSNETALAEGHRVAIEIPRLDPWGILVVEPATTTGNNTVWQPGIRAEPESRFSNQLAVRIDCATPGAVVRYTLDGAEPDHSSSRYTTTLALTRSTEIRAIALSHNQAGPEARARFTRIDGAGDAFPPDADPLHAALALWLSAESLSAEATDGDPVVHWPARAGPAAIVPASKLPGGRATSPPLFQAQALNGRAAIRFDGIDDQLVIDSFADDHLAGSPFTLFMVTRSASPDFGICGNNPTGGGGVPRLYLTRKSYRYNDLYKGLEPKVPGEAAAISVFAHDGRETISAWVNGAPIGQTAGLKAVPNFGGGGHLAMPFRAGNRGQAGDLAEIAVFTRILTDTERRGIEAWLADRYEIPVPRWK